MLLLTNYSQLHTTNAAYIAYTAIVCVCMNCGAAESRNVWQEWGLHGDSVF